MAITSEQLSPLIDRHWGPLVVWVGPRDEAADDIVQRTFIALAGLVELPSNVTAWLYATARNIAINERHQRQRRDRRQQSVARMERQASGVWASAEAAELVEKLNELSDDDRELIVAHLWGGLSLEDLSEVMNRSRASIYRDYKQALERLKCLYTTPNPSGRAQALT